MKKNYRKVLASVMAFLMLFSAAACGSDDAGNGGGPAAPSPADNAEEAGAGDSESAAPTTEDGARVIKIATPSDPGSLGTFDEGSSSGRWTVLAYTYENLAFQGSDGQYYPQMAKSWHLVPEKSTPTNVVYEIELFDYIYDTDGNHITADDVVFSFMECLENGTGNQHTALTGNMASIEKTGDYTVELVCKDEQAGSLERMLTYVMVVSEKAYKESGDSMRSNPIATGPYYVDEWVSGAYLTLNKNEDYWQTEELRQEIQHQNVDRIEYYFNTESAQMAIGLETGIYDVVTNLNYSNASRFMEGGQSSAGFAVEEVRDAYIQQMWVNRSENSPLNDLRIAQAVLYGIDIDGLIQVVVEGQGERTYCYGSDLNIGFLESWKSDNYYDYDVDKAKTLLEEAGYQPGDFTLTILCDTDEVRVKTAQVIQLYLQELGIEAEVTSYEQALWNTYQTDTTKYDLNISYNGVTGYVTAIWSQLDSTRYAEHNMAGVRDDVLDNLIITAAITQDPEDIDAAKQYMTEQAYHYGLFHKMLYYVSNTNVIADPVYNLRGNIIPGATAYVWN